MCWREFEICPRSAGFSNRGCRGSKTKGQRTCFFENDKDPPKHQVYLNWCGITGWPANLLQDLIDQEQFRSRVTLENYVWPKCLASTLMTCSAFTGIIATSHAPATVVALVQSNDYWTKCIVLQRNRAIFLNSMIGLLYFFLFLKGHPEAKPSPRIYNWRNQQRL